MIVQYDQLTNYSEFAQADVNVQHKLFHNMSEKFVSSHTIFNAGCLGVAQHYWHESVEIDWNNSELYEIELFVIKIWSIKDFLAFSKNFHDTLETMLLNATLTDIAKFVDTVQELVKNAVQKKLESKVSI